MDSSDWEAAVADPTTPVIWSTFYDVCKGLEGGNRIAWGLNLMQALCESTPGEVGNPHNLPKDREGMRQMLKPIIEPMSPQMRSKALRFLRALLAADAMLADIHAALPRYWRVEEAPVLARQMRIINTDCLPKGTYKPWVEELWRDVLSENRDRAWHTSATAKQELSMCHKFLRSTGWLDMEFKNLTEFKCFLVDTVSTQRLLDIANQFVDTLCHNDASAKRYRHIFRLLFVRQWRCISDEDFKSSVMSRCRKRVRDIERPEDLAALSEHSASTNVSQLMRHADREFHFTSEEESRLRAACVDIRDRLVLDLLITTGLRRRGLLNVTISNVADRDVGGRWIARDRGMTLTKKRRAHTFLLHYPAKQAIENWLNTAEDQGGRPNTASAFLLPSSKTDDGQLSVSALSHAFKMMCERAGIPKSSGKCHLHALRHTHAHRLRDAKNEGRVITASLGHSDPKTTCLYLRDAAVSVAAELTVPPNWQPPQKVVDRKHTRTKEDAVAREVLRDWARRNNHHTEAP